MSQFFQHINYLELLMVLLALRHLFQLLSGWHVLVRSDIITMVAFINRPGRGARSRPLLTLAQALLLRSRAHLLSLWAKHIPGCLKTRVETTPLGGCPVMREFQQRQRRSLRSSRKHGVLSIFVIERPECPIGNRRSGTPVASDPPFCVSNSGCDSAHVGEGLLGGS